MSFLTEDELIDSFGGGYSPAFAEIPDHLKTQKVAAGWFGFVAHDDFLKIHEYWQQIPTDLVTDALRHTALGMDAGLIRYMDTGDTEHYLALFARAHATSFRVTKLLPTEFRTSQAVEAMLESPSEFELSFLTNPWVAQVMTAEQMETAARFSAKVMVRLPVDKISENSLYIHLVEGAMGYHYLREVRKLSLAADFLKSGHWPQLASFVVGSQDKPKDIAEAVRLIDEPENALIQALNMAFLMTYPIDDVMALMTTRKLIKLAMEMYTDDELRPLMKTNKLLKSPLLEEALGL
jgi:hypothetical protein